MSGFRSNGRLRSRGVPQALRRKVLARDHHVCQLALADCLVSATEVDHIVPVFEGGTDDVANLRAVCSSCHKQKTQEEAQRAAGRMSRKREQQMHPLQAAILGRKGVGIPPPRRSSGSDGIGGLDVYGF